MGSRLGSGLESGLGSVLLTLTPTQPHSGVVPQPYVHHAYPYPHSNPNPPRRGTSTCSSRCSSAASCPSAPSSSSSTSSCPPSGCSASTTSSASSRWYSHSKHSHTCFRRYLAPATCNGSAYGQEGFLTAYLLWPYSRRAWLYSPRLHSPAALRGPHVT